MAVSAMKPSWAVMVGGSSLSVSLPHRKVSVLAAVALGLVAAAVVGAVVAAAAGAAVGLAAAAAVGAVVAAAAGGVVGLGAAGGLVGAAVGAAGPQAASKPKPAVRPAMPRNRRRESGDGIVIDSPGG